MASTKKVPLLVTTAHKGVFFGYGIPSAAKSLRIEKARMVVYWSSDVKGVLGLAATGPSKSCRIGPAVPAITLSDVTSVSEATKEAAAKFEEGAWSA